MPADQPQTPPHRYDAAMANRIETRWQQRWTDDGVFETPNPTGKLQDGFDAVSGQEPWFVMDMFPYPSGSGLHVGHPLGYIGTDVLARFGRMSGRNVLHTMGYDAFGLPAEQYAVQTGRHPRVTTEDNVANMRRQLGRLGLGHDLRRSVSTTDVDYYRWTQWIFLQIFESWFDRARNKARPITELVQELDNGTRSLDDGRNWSQLSGTDKQRVLLDYRLTYVDDAPVNWCPGLGTVLANEEVTNEGRSERGNYPVYRRSMRQWKMRITEYAERLLTDLDDLDWSESVKTMQRNWIGRSTGANVTFAIDGHDSSLEVFTTRPDTLFGATYMVVAPEHPLLDQIVTSTWPSDVPASWRGASVSSGPKGAVDAYVQRALNASEIERTDDTRQKTGVFTGAYCINPVSGARLPVFVADYVLGGYGTGAIMAVPAHDERDFQFAKAFDLPLVAVVQPPADWFEDGTPSPAGEWKAAYTGPGKAISSANDSLSLDGMDVETAKAAMSEWLVAHEVGGATVTFKLRDWLFSRQRYWGEPFPIVWDGDIPVGVPASQLPVELPVLNDYAPVTSEDNESQPPEPPLGRATEWRNVTLDLGDGPREYRRELNTMPQWAGSCWYYLRYMDPTNGDALVDPSIEAYWSGDSNKSGTVDLYIGGVEHAVLHLLYARFWHKVLFDLGHVSKPEPFQRLFNQGMIQADAFTDSRGIYVDAHAVVAKDDGTYEYEGAPVTRITGKMGKSLKNSVNPDDMYRDFGADSLRLYEMAMGPLDTDRPWSDQGIIGLYRFLQRMWRNFVDEESGELRLAESVSKETTQQLHKTIAGVRADFEGLRFNTAVSKLIELNNHLTKAGPADRTTAEAMVLMLAPLAPHIAEELWFKLGHEQTLVRAPFPVADQSLLMADTAEIPVQVQGKVRGKVVLPIGASEAEATEAALAEPSVRKHLEGYTVAKVVVIQDRMINIVRS